MEGQSWDKLAISMGTLCRSINVLIDAFVNGNMFIYRVSPKNVYTFQIIVS